MAIQQNTKFHVEQYATILNFLEDPQNKAKIFGVSGKTEVGVAPPCKIDAWKELATPINTKFKGKYKVDHKSVANRWRTYFNKYKLTRDKSSTTDFGVSDNDKKRNIHTVQAKLDDMCPHYERIHALVGERPNVKPAATFDSDNITLGSDLNELVKFTEEEVPNIIDDEPTIAIVDSSGPHDVTTNANEVEVAPHTLVVSNEEVILSPSSEQNQGTTWPEPECDRIFPSDLHTSPIVQTSTKRLAVLDNSDAKKSKKDCKKELPSLSGTKNPTQSHNHLAQTIQDCASSKAVALVTIEQKRLKFEQMKWETEQTKWETEQMKLEVRRREDKDDEILKRAEKKAEKCRERRFALLQTMLADEKSPS